MKRLLLVAALVVLVGVPRVAAAQTESASVHSAALTEEVRLLIEARLASFAKGDSAAFHRMIVPGYVHVYDGGWPGSGPKLLQSVGRQRPDSASSKVAPVYTVTEVQTRREGQVLLAHALVTQQFHIGSRMIANRWRETNALIRSRGHWLFVQHSETPMLALGGYPVAAPVPDSASLAAFVGDYEWWPGFVDRITERGGRLYGQDPDHPEEQPHPFVAAGGEAFYPDNDSSGLSVFVRDTSGRVAGYYTRVAGGPLIVARKIR